MLRIRKTVAWLSLATCLLLRVGGPDGLVICIGVDGHLEFEAARDGVCYARTSEKGAEPLPEPVYAEEPDADRCCVCVDIPLSVDGLSFYIRPVIGSPTQPDVLDVPAVESATEAPMRVEQVRASGLPPPSTGPPHDSIATVILLC